MPTFTTWKVGKVGFPLRLLHVSTLEPSAAALHGDRAGGHKMRCIRAVQRDERHGSHGGMEALGWEQWFQRLQGRVDQSLNSHVQILIPKKEIIIWLGILIFNHIFYSFTDFFSVGWWKRFFVLGSLQKFDVGRCLGPRVSSFMGPTSTGVAWRCYSKPTERSQGKKILRVLAALGKHEWSVWAFWGGSGLNWKGLQFQRILNDILTT